MVIGNAMWSSSVAAGGMSDEDEAGAKSMLDDFEAWLDQAEE